MSDQLDLTHPEQWRDYYVYRLYDAAGELLYVGSTSNVRRRVQEHRRNQPWGHLIASSAFGGPLPQQDAWRLEDKTIREQRPRYNQRRPPHVEPTIEEMRDALAKLAALIVPPGFRGRSAA